MLLGSSGSVHASTFKIRPTSMEGQMETTPIRVLINSISRFIHLVSCQMMKPIPIQKDYRNMVRVLRLLKPVLDDIVDFNVDEILCKECEELDLIVNEAREFMENWSLKMSKICSVMRSEPLSMKIQSSSLEICRILHMHLQSSSSTSSSTGAQHCMKEIQCLKQDKIMEHIDSAVRSQRDGFVPCSQHLGKIMEMLSLTSNKELLKETVAVEKERISILASNSKEELDKIDQIVELVSNIREFMVKTMQFDITSGVPIPPYFRCPLSLELMLDPVIVASGQTYERSSIQKWLDHGMSICPKTRQVLVHTNLIPNFTVKAMIASWCEENSSRLLSNSENPIYVPVSSQSDYVSGQDLTHVDSSRYSLLSSDSASRSLEIGTGFQKLKVDASPRFSEDESNGCQRRDGEKFDNPSPEQSYIHSRTESTSSVISSFDYVPSPYKNEHTTDLSGEITHEGPAPALAPSKKESGFSPWLSGKQFYGSKARVGLTRNGSRNSIRSQSLPVSDLGSDDLITTSQVKKLVEDLLSSSNEIQTTAAAELRLLAKNNVENRIIIGHCGAIAPLLSLLYSEVKLTQEHAVTTLLNLSINEDNKAMIAEAGAIEPLIHVLKSGNDGAKENSAAALFSLSVLEEFKAKIGRSGAVKALVDLLGSGTLRGKKDAATALFNLSIFHENKARIVQAGAVKYLVKLMDPETGMVDKALALLANLATIGDGRLSIAREGAIPLVVEIVESGSQRGKENAASVLLQLCINNPKFCTLVLQEGAIPPLVALSQSGTPRAKEKAQQLLSHFRNLREGVTGKGKP